MIYPALLGPFKFMPNCSVGQSECKMKFSSQEIRYGLRKMHGFHGNRLYDSQDWGVGLQIQSYLGFYLS